MKAITLRNLPAPLELRLRRKADQEGLSLNRAVISALEEAFGLRRKRRPPAFHDLDFVIGSLSRKDADALHRSVRSQRQVDPGLWP